MPSFRLRSLVKPSFLIMLSIASGAMATGPNAFAAPGAGPQALENLIHGSQESSVTHISCSGDQFNKCVQYCVDSHRRLEGRDNLAGCRSYCRQSSSSEGGCPR